MPRRKVETGFTSAEIAPYIVLFTLMILYICMFISISYYVQHVKQKQEIEKPDVGHSKIVNNLGNGLERNEIEKDKLATYVTGKYSLLTREVTYNRQHTTIPSQQSTISTQQTTLISKVSQAIQYEYKKIAAANCPSNDIKLIYSDVNACIKECDAIENCVGFVFRLEVGKHCWLKYKCDVTPIGTVVYVYLKQ